MPSVFAGGCEGLEIKAMTTEREAEIHLQLESVADDLSMADHLGERYLRDGYRDLKREIDSLRTKLSQVEKERDAEKEHHVVCDAACIGAMERLDTALSESKRLRRALAESKKAIRLLMPLAMNAVPQRGHMGACGPESACDGICMEVASCAEVFRAARAALENKEESPQ